MHPGGILVSVLLQVHLAVFPRNPYISSVEQVFAPARYTVTSHFPDSSQVYVAFLSTCFTTNWWLVLRNGTA